MKLKSKVFRLLIVVSLVFSWSVLYADPGESMADESVQSTDQAESEAQATSESENEQKSSPCSDALRSDSAADQIQGAHCAVEHKDKAAIADLIHVLKTQENSDVVTEVVYALAALGAENGDTTGALIEKANDKNVKAADRYIIVAALAALRTDEDKDQISEVLTNIGSDDSADDLLKDLATKLTILLAK